MTRIDPERTHLRIADHPAVRTFRDSSIVERASSRCALPGERAQKAARVGSE
jgi:hypothetical protein